MIVVEYKRIELDYCTHCSGAWFDAGELELLLEALGVVGGNISVAAVLTSKQAKSTEKRRKCPICGNKMKKATIGHDSEVLIDACPRGDGLWFDKGEIEAIITQLSDRTLQTSDSQTLVVDFLGQVFAKHE